MKTDPLVIMNTLNSAYAQQTARSRPASGERRQIQRSSSNATAASTVSSLLSDRSDAMVILVGLIIVAILWIWKVLIPQRESDQALREADKKIHQENAATLSKLSAVTASIHSNTAHSNTTIRAMLEVKEIELDCIGMISNHTQCDVRDKLAEAKGVLRAVRSGATTDQ